MTRSTRSPLGVAALLVASLSLSACIFASGRGDPVTGILPGSTPTGSELSLSADKTVLVIGDKLPLTLAGAGASPSQLAALPAFASSDPKVATVDSKGVVTAVNVGQVTITATVVDKQATVALRVVTSTAPEVLQVASVSISPGSQTVEKVGSQLVFTALARDASGAAIPGISVFWFSSNPNVATIAQTGVLTITGSGTTEITASAGEQKSSASVISVPGGSANVNVDFGAL